MIPNQQLSPTHQSDSELEFNSEMTEEEEDETPTASDQEFIVSDSEMTDVSSTDSLEDDVAVLTESYLHLMEEFKIISKENKVIKDHLSKQQDLLWEIYETVRQQTC